MIARIVCGSRTYRDKAAIERVLKPLIYSGNVYPRTGVVVIHGDAAGADRIARDVAINANASVVAMPYIGSLGKRGGMARNHEMLKVLYPLMAVGWDVGVIAFVDKPLVESRGTAGMVNIARSAGIPVEVFEP